MRPTRLMMVVLCALVLLPAAALAQARPWKLPYDFRMPGQTSGFASVVLRAVNDRTGEVLRETSINVMVKDWRFQGQFALAASDADAAQRMGGVTSLRLEFARTSAPADVLGTILFAAPAYAMTLSPNAVLDRGGPTALPVTGSAAGVRALSTSGGAAVGAEVLSTAAGSFNAAVEGLAQSASGAGGHFINGSGDLLRADHGEAGTPAFRVASNGDAFTRGALIPQYGPKGETGDTGTPGQPGAPGPAGSKGPRGDVAPFLTFGVATRAPNCTGVCKGTATVISAVAVGDSGCQLTTDQGTVSNFVSGACCVCAPLP